jgi:hypothetical protein
MLGESVNGKLQKTSCVCVWKKEDEEGRMRWGRIASTSNDPAVGQGDNYSIYLFEQSIELQAPALFLRDNDWRRRR